jgi:hypothetical protein
MTSTDPERGWLWPLTGLGFVAASSSAILFSTLLPPEPYPSPFGPPLGPSTDIARFFTEARPQVVAMSFVITIGALFLVAFGAQVASLAWRRSTDGGTFGWLALASAELAAAFWLLTAMVLWVLARPWTPEQPNLLRAMHDLTYLLGGPAHVLLLGMFAGAGAASLSGTAGVPAWTRWIGFAAAAASLASVVALLVDVATLLLPVGRGLAMLWIVAVSLGVAWSRWRVATQSVDRRPPFAAGSKAG